MTIDSGRRVSEGARTEPRTSALAKRVLDEYAAARDSLPAGVVGPQRRQAAIEALAARGLPTSREENWRYTNLRPLERARFVPVAAQTVSVPELPARLEGFARYTFVDGTLTAGDAQSEGVSITAARQPRALPALTALPEARLALLNEAFAIDTAAIHVRGMSKEPARVELVFVALAGADVGASYPRVEISLDPASRLILVERHLSAAGAASLVNSSVNVDVGRGARLTHYRLQQVSARATWLDTLS
ncbi:MAG: hypothetical protein ACRETJ_12850, partial [Steroidobacteraceae bacterium]